ncbi:acyl carrier protein [Dactylosporangium sp. NPDC051541]|uniref:acyl carrier protein n=1 Tax=Dactylosporangium sp. NPDC051541 TaxID=3363977 RepID=UPI0037A87A6F
MSDVVSEEEISARLVQFIRERLLDGTAEHDIDERTPLLDRGILDSMKTAVLLNFIRTELGTQLPPAALDGANFVDVRTIAAMVHAH